MSAPARNLSPKPVKGGPPEDADELARARKRNNFRELAGLPDWPGMMRLEVAAAYCMMSVDSFQKCVDSGRFPPAVQNLPVRVTVWSRAALDRAAANGGTIDDASAREAAWRARHEGRTSDAR